MDEFLVTTLFNETCEGAIEGMLNTSPTWG